MTTVSPWCMPWMTLKSHYALCFKTHASFGAHHRTTNIWMKIDPYHQRWRCSPITLVSGNIRFLRISEVAPWRGGVKRRGVKSKTSIFRAFGRYVIGTLGNEANIVIFSPFSPFRLHQKTTLNDLETWNLEWPFYVKVSLLRTAFQQVG